MALLGSHIQVLLRYVWLDQRCENVFTYHVGGTILSDPSAVGIAEAWWNDVKDDIRALCSNDTGAGRFESVVVRQLVAGGALAEFAIPSGEQPGTRAFGSAATALPGTLGQGFRMTVATTVTRPGQKRFPFLVEGDTVGNSLVDPMLSLLQTVADHVTAIISLGSPVALTVLQPEIGGTMVGLFPTVYQDVIGNVVNSYVTSQVSRKRGHGS